MEPQVEARKGPMSNCLTCEIPDQEAPTDDTETAPTSKRCDIFDTETSMFDWGTETRGWIIILDENVFHHVVSCVLENTQPKTTKATTPAPVVRIQSF